MTPEAFDALADLLVATQTVVQSGGGPQVLGLARDSWMRARAVLGLAGRWHTRDEALAALRGAAGVAPGGGRGGVAGVGVASSPDTDEGDMAAYMDSGLCQVCLSPNAVQQGTCQVCGSPAR